MRKIILASASPRRSELLRQIGLKFEVDPCDEAEFPLRTDDPKNAARRISQAKAVTVAARHKDAIIIAADTFGVIDGKILGKPKSAENAREMLQTISGRYHEVITGFTIIDTSSRKIVSRAVETSVFMKKLTPEEIESYIESKEPLDKAAAYAIQGLGAVIIKRIEGDYFNVVGLPLEALSEALKEFDIRVL
ncbi:MAG: septum formation protein Maf [Chloroflexi bacterium RBG_16_48_7]|nr:MAG: septum formation protein Maf [Chloroflexi bacterium RBG_16_48_7]